MCIIVNTFWYLIVDNEHKHVIIVIEQEVNKTKERIKSLRESLGLSQEEFGKRIGSARNTIANYELGRRNPSNTVLNAICRTYNANYEWLANGNGDMFNSTPSSVVDEIAEEFNLDEVDKNIIAKYLELSPDQRKVLKEYLKSVFAG